MQQKNNNSEEGQKLWSKTFKISNKMLSILSLLAVAAIWFSKTTSLPKISFDFQL